MTHASTTSTSASTCASTPPASPRRSSTSPTPPASPNTSCTSGVRWFPSSTASSTAAAPGVADSSCTSRGDSSIESAENRTTSVAGTSYRAVTADAVAAGVGWNSTVPPPPVDVPRVPAKAVLHFIGGAFVGAIPHTAYRTLLTRLAARGYIILATPYTLSFNYLSTLSSLLTPYGRATTALALDYGPLPVIGVGHSAGALLHLLAGALFRDDADKAANILISWNNKSAADAVPLPGLSSLIPAAAAAAVPQPYRGLPHLIKPTPYERAQQTPTSHAPLTTSSAPLPFRQALIRASTATPSSTRLVSLLRLYTEAGSRQQPAHDRPIRHTPGARQARLTWPSPPRRAPLPPARARRAPPAGGR